MTVREPTAAEREFFEAVSSEVGDLQDWYLVDDNGCPWMMVSFDVVQGGGIRETWRLDYDGTLVVGGRSPACLNWDAEIRADAANVDTGPPDGVMAEVASPAEAAAIASAWFHQRIGQG